MLIATIVIIDPLPPTTASPASETPEELEAIIEQARRRQRRRRQRYAWAAGALLAGLVVAFAGHSGGGSYAPAGVAAPPPSPSPPTGPVGVTARNGQIVGFGLLGGVRELGRRGVPTGYLVRCGAKCTLVSGADWSGDGRLLAYSTACAGGCGSMGLPSHGIHVRNTRSGVDRLLVHGDFWDQLGISADGSRIAYSEGRHLYVVATHGSAAPRRIADAAGSTRVGKPSFSPDGSWLVYANDGDVHLIRADGAGERVLTRGSIPVWSPNGRWIAYFFQGQLRLISPNGARRRVVELAAGAGIGNGASSPDWSPDGRRLAMLQRRGRLVVVTIASGRVRHWPGRVSAFFGAGIAWQPVKP